MTSRLKRFPAPPALKLPPSKLWINGQWRAPASGRFFDTRNPATEEILMKVALADASDIDLAARAARRAFEEGPWPRMTAGERRQILQRIARMIQERGEELALLETADCGKPVSFSRQIDIPSAAASFDYYAGWTDKIYGQTMPLNPEFLTYTLREPLGVIAAITPWNFPLSIASQKTAAALAAGNTVVLKPAEQTPLTALCLAEITAEAGLPPGVLNVLTGDGPLTGAALVAHPEVDGVSFTGEHTTGQEIMRQAAAGLKRLSFELGGKSANIIFADADLEKAARFACDGIFFNQGEVCCAGSRLFADKKIEKPLTKLILEFSKEWQPGDPMDPKTQMGAIVSREQLQKIHGFIDLGQKEGAHLTLDGRRPSGGKGYFVGPTLFTGVGDSMRLAREEIFGPVLSEIVFDDFDAVIAQANGTLYGLAASVWTRDIQKAHRAARRLKSGTVWINTFGDFDHAMPFGGYKMSGMHREGGPQTFDFYTQTKSVWARLE